MAYPHTKYEIKLLSAVDLAATGDKTPTYSPAYQPHYIRAVAAVIKNDVGATGTINFDKRITAGSDTGRVGDVITALSLTTAHVGGKVVYRDHLNVVIRPGEELVVAIDDAAASGDVADIILYVEPSWEVPANNAAMVASA